MSKYIITLGNYSKPANNIVDARKIAKKLVFGSKGDIAIINKFNPKNPKQYLFYEEIQIGNYGHNTKTTFITTK